ncbi:MAG: hypothetical protein IKJ59_07545 [Clostridia bacterium]|nr:hypothetical protein [Clostridia bacterium]
MKIIKYIQLFNYIVTEEDSNPINACRVIQKIRQLPDELKLAVLDVVEGKIPYVEFHDISLEELINNDKMKPVRAILMLDWIRREPAIAMRYMEIECHRAPQTVTDSDKEMLEKVLEKLNTKDTIIAEENKEDIEIVEK